MAIELIEYESNGVKVYGIMGIEQEDLYTLSLALKPMRKELANEIHTLQNPTIQALSKVSTQVITSVEIAEKASHRLFMISQAINGSAKKGFIINQPR